MTDTAGQQDTVRIIAVKSRMALLAGSGGGKSAAAMIAAADSFIAAERSRFLEWAGKDLIALEALLGRLHDSRGGDAVTAEAAYRKAAEIRDLGGTFGYRRITDIADSLCELLYRLREAGLYNRAAIAMHEAALRLVCTATQPSDAAGEELLSGLRRIVDKYPRPQPAGGGTAAAAQSLSGAQ